MAKTEPPAAAVAKTEPPGAGDGPTWAGSGLPLDDFPPNQASPSRSFDLLDSAGLDETAEGLSLGTANFSAFDQDHARVEELIRKLHIDPTDDAVVDELTGCLLRLGRSHELFAVLAARLDEAGPTRRAALLPKQREVLRRLEDDARLAGRADEAELYRFAREAL